MDRGRRLVGVSGERKGDDGMSWRARQERKGEGGCVLG